MFPSRQKLGILYCSIKKLAHDNKTVHSQECLKTSVLVKSVRLKSYQVHHIIPVTEPNYNINLSLPCWEETNGNEAPVLQRKHKLLLHFVFITSVLISLGINLLLFQLLRSLKQQAWASFAATRKPTCLERYPDISKISETRELWGGQCNSSALYIGKCGVPLLLTLVCLFFYTLAWLPAGLLLIHLLAPNEEDI